MNMTMDKLATAVATRRGSLALGSAALLGLAHAPIASAKKKKSCKKKSRKKVDQACGQQVNECVAYFTPFCALAPNPQQCLTSVDTCCAPLESCSFTEMMQCAATL